MNHEKEKWILLVLLSLIWGSSFILIKKSLEHFNPYQVGALKEFLFLGFYSRRLVEHKKVSKSHLKWLIIAALCGNLFYVLISYCGNQSQQQYCRNYQFYDATFRYFGRCSILGNQNHSSTILGIVISFWVILLMNSGHDNNTEHLFYIGLLLLLLSCTL